MIEINVGITEVVPGIRIPWINAQRLPVGGNLFVSLVELAVGTTEVVPGFRILWIDAQRFTVGGNRLVRLLEITVVNTEAVPWPTPALARQAATACAVILFRYILLAAVG